MTAAAAASSESQPWFLKHERNVAIDRDHLQGLDPTLAVMRADVMLCADDGNHCLLDFPVHSKIISAQSPVLFQLLEAQRSNGVSDQQPLRLPLLKNIDSLYSDSTMRAVVTYLYTQECERPLPSRFRWDFWDKLPVQVECMRLFHKYSMEEMLMVHLHRPLENLVKLGMAQLDHVLEFAVNAEDCGCLSIMKTREVYIAIKCLDDQNVLRHINDHGLSHAGTLRISQVVLKSQSKTIQDMDTALRRFAGEALANHCKCSFYHGMCCPRCGRRLKLSKKKNVVHKGNKPCKCTWPRQQTYRPVATLTRFEEIEKLFDRLQM